MLWLLAHGNTSNYMLSYLWSLLAFLFHINFQYSGSVFWSLNCCCLYNFFGSLWFFWILAYGCVLLLLLDSQSQWTLLFFVLTSCEFCRLSILSMFLYFPLAMCGLAILINIVTPRIPLSSFAFHDCACVCPIFSDDCPYRVCLWCTLALILF